ncbi:uncharacterized protein LOC133920786 [Phragmites australis]|uniref:uncharacterized protein LOC133920786 n=1 Tax=Phragmites australis TaxID=29695 RepID=UPI002D785F55|nr:uncharacterized protein LOC133920786 [Phragmites australis]
MQGANKKHLVVRITIPRCTFSGGDENGAFTGEQLRYPCKLRRHICARCGKHRGEHRRASAGIWEEHLPPRKRPMFRRLGQQFLRQGGGKMEKREEGEEGEIWNGDAITKGKRGPRRKRAEMLRADKFE